MKNNPFHHLIALKDFSDLDCEQFSQYLTIHHFQDKEEVVLEEDTSRGMYFVLEGEVSVKRANIDLGSIHAGQHFGELALIAMRPRAASIVAKGNIVLAALSLEAFENMSVDHPVISLRLLRALISYLGLQLTDMTDSVQLLLSQRLLPRKLKLEVILQGKKKQIKTGIFIRELFSEEIEKSPIVAALLDQKAVSLNTQIFSDAQIEPLRLDHWEGERIYRRSLTLLLLEAISQLHPNLNPHLGTSMGNLQWIYFHDTHSIPKDLVPELEQKMLAMIQKQISFRKEWWTIEEAIVYFQEHKWDQAALFLQTWSSPNVPMVSCGQHYVVSFGPLVDHTKQLNRFEIQFTSNTKGILLISASGTKPNVQSFQPYANVMANHERWLNSLQINSVGEFNQVCISGKVSQTIAVAEGFHEKHISQLSDRIVTKPEIPRIICIAGPSSSGKTTFIKRLSVQLQVNGLHPVTLSLDDYYRNRSECPRDEQGQFDFETLDAFDLGLLRRQMQQLLNGEQISTARFDFKAGINDPNGGKEICLGPKDILLLEGLHCLNPVLLENAVSPDWLFRIFIQPMTSLPFDHFSRVNTSDLRLLRRIVRDRHGRGCHAADNIMLWPSVRRGEQLYIYPYVDQADSIFDTSLIYEISVLKIFAERYLLEVPRKHPAYVTAYRLRQLINHFVTIHSEHVPPTSILREFIGGSGFEY